MSSDITSLDSSTKLATFQESSLDSFEGIVGQLVSHWKRDRTAKSKDQKDQKAIEQLRHIEVIHRSLMQPESKPTEERKPRARERKSYLPPSREGKVSVIAYLEPEVKEALDKKYESSAFTSFQEFLADGLERLSKEQPEELKPSAELSHVALAQTRELEKTITRLTQDLSTRTRT